MSKRQELLDLINPKITEVRTNEKEGKPAPKPRRKSATRETVNRANSQDSTGPRTPEGKEKASANSLKHGYYASLAKLNPRNSLAFHHIHDSLSRSLHPDGRAESHLAEEIAMLSARLQSLESAQFALIAGNTEGEPAKIENPKSYTDGELYDLRQPDARDVAHAYERCLDTLERLTKIEVHLRRAYNRSWDRLQRMQRDRKKMPQRTGRFEGTPRASSVVRDQETFETIKRTQARLTIEAIGARGSACLVPRAIAEKPGVDFHRATNSSDPGRSPANVAHPSLLNALSSSPSSISCRHCSAPQRPGQH